MSDAALTIHGARTNEDGDKVDLTGTVSGPEQIGGTGDWLCTVRCAGLFPDEIIKGANAAQALHLSRLFLLDALETNGVQVENTDNGAH